MKRGSDPYSDPEHVVEQYRDASRLDARVRIYRLFAQRDDGFYEWLFDRLDLGPDTRVLDVGAGTGNLWLENAPRLKGSYLVLGDLSPGMLDSARERLARAAVSARFTGLDAQSLPFATASFDVVLANHMLYHVPDRPRALAEVHRVLAPGGTFYTATNGWSHLLEMRELVRRFGVESALRPASSSSDGWDLEQAAREVGERFADLRLESYRDALRVTDPEPLLDAIRSMGGGDAADAPALEALRRHVEWSIGLEGFFHIGTWAGLVSARR